MFAYKRTMVGILTLVVIIVSFCISCIVTDVFDECYWYTICSIMFAELQLGLIGMELLKTDERAMPIFAGNLVVATQYFVFTIVMIFVDLSAKNSLILHSIVLLLMITLHIFLGLAHHSTKNNAKNQTVALQIKKDFLSALEEFKMNRSEWLMEDPVLAKKISHLLDEARFTPESIADTTEVDLLVFQKINELRNAADRGAAKLCADELKAAFSYRRKEITNNR